MSYAPPGETSQQLLEERIDLDSTVITGIFYGMLFVLYISTFRHLWIQKKRHGRRAWFFLSYITIMFLLGTLYLIASIWTTQAGFVDYRNYPGGPLGFASISDSFPLVYMGNVIYVLADWFADALLMWRCAVIWRGSWLRPLLVVPFAMFLANIALSILILLQINQPTNLNPNFDASTAYFIVSLVNTVLISVIIVVRILMQRIWIAGVSDEFGSHAKQYNAIVAMIVESAALYSAFSIAFLITYELDSPLSDLFLPLLSQIQIISPLLIIYRVAQGHDMAQEFSMNGAVADVEDIQFATGPTPGSSNVLNITNWTDRASMGSMGSAEQKAETANTFAGAVFMAEKLHSV